jgi:hypothetical protein
MNLDPLVGWMPQHAGTQALSDRWLAHNERGGKLVQHRVDQDEPSGRAYTHTQHLRQWIWLKEAACGS